MIYIYIYICDTLENISITKIADLFIYSTSRGTKEISRMVLQTNKNGRDRSSASDQYKEQFLSRSFFLDTSLTVPEYVKLTSHLRECKRTPTVFLPLSWISVSSASHYIFHRIDYFFFMFLIDFFKHLIFVFHSFHTFLEIMINDFYSRSYDLLWLIFQITYYHHVMLHFSWKSSKDIMH